MKRIRSVRWHLRKTEGKERILPAPEFREELAEYVRMGGIEWVRVRKRKGLRSIGLNA